MSYNNTRKRLNELFMEHKDLDDSILLLQEKPFVDELQLRRLKVRKLKIKDEIKLLESRLIPDMDA